MTREHVRKPSVHSFALIVLRIIEHYFSRVHPYPLVWNERLKTLLLYHRNGMKREKKEKVTTNEVSEYHRQSFRMWKETTRRDLSVS